MNCMKCKNFQIFTLNIKELGPLFLYFYIVFYTFFREFLTGVSASRRRLAKKVKASQAQIDAESAENLKKVEKKPDFVF